MLPTNAVCCGVLGQRITLTTGAIKEWWSNSPGDPAVAFLFVLGHELGHRMTLCHVRHRSWFAGWLAGQPPLGNR